MVGFGLCIFLWVSGSWVVEGILRRLLFCKANNAMNQISVAGGYSCKKEKEEERFCWLVTCGWSGSEGRLLYVFMLFGLWLVVEQERIQWGWWIGKFWI